MKILIKSVKIIDQGSALHHKTVDILIEEGQIKAIEEAITAQADREISMKGLHASVGWFDSGVCFGEPGYEERETLANGLLTAAKSGFTAIALHPDTFPVTDNSGAVSFLKNKSLYTATQLYPIGALTQKSEGQELAELFDMKNAGAVAFGDYKKAIRDPNLLKIALQYAQSFDALLMDYPDEPTLSHGLGLHEGLTSTKMGLKGIPGFVEEIQVHRDIKILAYTGGKLHIPTLSTAAGVELIAAAKQQKLDVSCSVSISSLFFTDERLEGFDSAYKVLPPLRSETDRQALIKGVKEGIIDMVTADHRPMNVEFKKLEFEQASFGSTGLESAFGALCTVVETDKGIELLTSGYERFGITRPELKAGSEANITLFVPDITCQFDENHIFSQSKNSMFTGEKLKGKVVGVFANNQLILNDE